MSAIHPDSPHFHPDDLLTDEEWAERNAEMERNLAEAYAADARFRIQRHAVYGPAVEAPVAEDYAALERVGWTAEQVISWLPAPETREDGRAR